MGSDQLNHSIVIVLVALMWVQPALGKWKAITSGSNNTVYALTVYNGQLIACGHSGGNPPATGIGISRWNGKQWQQLAPELDNTYYCLTEYNGDLIVGGPFIVVDGIPANRIARWDGKQWHPLGSGMADSYCSGGGATVEVLTVYNNELIAGGCFTMPGQNANNIASWDGASWNAIGNALSEPKSL